MIIIIVDRRLREMLMRADIEGVPLVDSSLEVFYRRDERSPGTRRCCSTRPSASPSRSIAVECGSVT